MSIQIFTSNFSKARKLSNKYYLKVCISRTRPQNYRGLWLPILAPSLELLDDYHHGLNEKHYEERYREEIAQINDLRSIFASLTNQTKGRDILLLCYERASNFCHRFILSDIVFEKYGYRINEI